MDGVGIDRKGGTGEKRNINGPGRAYGLLHVMIVVNKVHGRAQRAMTGMKLFPGACWVSITSGWRSGSYFKEHGLTSTLFG